MPQRANGDVDDNYEDRYVAYLDMLGFKMLVEIAERNPAKRPMLRQILELVRDTLCENPSLGMHRTHFSDCIVFSAQRTREGLWEMIQSINSLTFNLLQYDVLVRGGIAGGCAYHGQDFVYGTSVNRAYMLESRCAKSPITLVSREVVDDARTYSECFVEWLLEDSPQRYFVHYLREYAEYRHEPIYAGKLILDRPGQRVIDFVCQRLNTDTGSVLAKAEWLRAYWNRTVAVHGVFGSIEAGVKERYDSGGPTIKYRRIAGSS